MRVTVIGGSGHIGTYLVPRLVWAGHEVTVVTRGRSTPYQANPAWEKVRSVTLNRGELEGQNRFGEEILRLEPEAVIDLICFTPASAAQLLESLRGRIRFFAHCGSLWVRARGSEVPADEAQPRNPISEYGRNKNAIENLLLTAAHRDGFPATVLHPGHITGPGWAFVGPTACHDLGAVERCIRGEEIVLPNQGMETVHHVHADDVAQSFILALEKPSRSIGEAFFIGSRHAMTLRGLAEGLAERFGRQAKLAYLPYPQWLDSLPAEWRDGADGHFLHCTNASVAKAQRELGYQPRYSSLEAVTEATQWMIDQGKITLSA